jgi:hypothetical protein
MVKYNISKNNCRIPAVLWQHTGCGTVFRGKYTAVTHIATEN